VILLNVSRGALIDEAALVRCRNRWPDRRRGALTCTDQEPLAREGHPLSQLYGRENVILFPHLTFYTSEAMQRLEEEPSCAALKFLKAGRCLCVQTSAPARPDNGRAIWIDERTGLGCLTMT